MLSTDSKLLFLLSTAVSKLLFLLLTADGKLLFLLSTAVSKLPFQYLNTNFNAAFTTSFQDITFCTYTLEISSFYYPICEKCDLKSV